MGESTWRRAWTDTEKFRRGSRLWFWAVEVVGGGAIFGVGGSLIGSALTPPSATTFWQNAYPVIGGGIGVVIGFVVVFSLILAWNLFRAPYQQRDEARQLCRKHKQTLRDTRLKHAGKDNISLVYDPNFYPCCKEVCDDKSEIHRIGVHNVGAKTLEDVEVLLVSGESNLRPEPLTSPLSPMHSACGSLSSFGLNPTSDWYLKTYVDFIRWLPKTKIIQLCYHHNVTKSTVPFHDTYKLKREQKYFISLGATARHARIDAQWSAEVFVDRYGKINIDLSKVEVFEI